MRSFFSTIILFLLFTQNIYSMNKIQCEFKCVKDPNKPHIIEDTFSGSKSAYCNSELTSSQTLCEEKTRCRGHDKEDTDGNLCSCYSACPQALQAAKDLCKKTVSIFTLFGKTQIGPMKCHAIIEAQAPSTTRPKTTPTDESLLKFIPAVGGAKVYAGGIPFSIGLGGKNLVVISSVHKIPSDFLLDPIKSATDLIPKSYTKASVSPSFELDTYTIIENNADGTESDLTTSPDNVQNNGILYSPTKGFNVTKYYAGSLSIGAKIGPSFGSVGSVKVGVSGSIGKNVTLTRKVSTYREAKEAKSKILPPKAAFFIPTTLEEIQKLNLVANKDSVKFKTNVSIGANASVSLGPVTSATVAVSYSPTVQTKITIKEGKKIQVSMQNLTATQLRGAVSLAEVIGASVAKARAWYNSDTIDAEFNLASTNPLVHAAFKSFVSGKLNDFIAQYKQFLEEKTSQTDDIKQIVTTQATGKTKTLKNYHAGIPIIFRVNKQKTLTSEQETSTSFDTETGAQVIIINQTAAASKVFSTSALASDNTGKSTNFYARRTNIIIIPSADAADQSITQFSYLTGAFKYNFKTANFGKWRKDRWKQEAFYVAKVFGYYPELSQNEKFFNAFEDRVPKNFGNIDLSGEILLTSSAMNKLLTLTEEEFASKCTANSSQQIKNYINYYSHAFQPGRASPLSKTLAELEDNEYQRIIDQLPPNFSKVQNTDTSKDPLMTRKGQLDYLRQLINFKTEALCKPLVTQFGKFASQIGRKPYTDDPKQQEEELGYLRNFATFGQMVFKNPAFVYAITNMLKEPTGESPLSVNIYWKNEKQPSQTIEVVQNKEIAVKASENGNKLDVNPTDKRLLPNTEIAQEAEKIEDDILSKQAKDQPLTESPFEGKDGGILNENQMKDMFIMTHTDE